MTADSPAVLLSQSWINWLFIQGFNCCFLTHIQVSQEIGKVVWYSHIFKSFPQFVMIHTVKGFSIVNETEVDVFLEFSCFLCDPANVGNLISGSNLISGFLNSSASVVGAQTWMTVMLNGLLWKWTEIILIFEVAPKYCNSGSFVDYEGYSISSMRFLPTVVDIMVIWIKLTQSCPF